MKNRVIIIFLSFLMFNTFALADDVKKGGIERIELSFEQAYQLMLENNNSLKAYNELIKQKQYEKKSAIGQFLPKVMLNASYIHFSDDMTLTSSGSIKSPMGTVSFSANTLIQENNLFTAGGIAV